MAFNFKKIIIDGYNLINAAEPLKESLDRGLEAARNDLIIRLQGLKGRSTNTEITVVFDGREAHSSTTEKKGGIRILYSRPPANADRVIKELVGKQKNPHLTLVVSSDHEIAGFARICGAKAMRSQEFYRRVTQVKQASGKDRQSEKPQMTDASLEEWEQLFDVDNFEFPKRRTRRTGK